MTKKAISVWAKMNFLHWFAETQGFTSDGAKQLLLYIANSEELLARLKIVFDGSQPRPLLVISTEGTGMPSFLLKTDFATVADHTVILDYLEVPTDDYLYLTLYFPDRMTNEPYLAVIEEIPTQEPEISRQVLIDFELSLWIEEFKREMKRTELLNKIDKALDNRDKRAFRRLVKQLKQL